MNATVVEASGLVKNYYRKTGALRVLNGIDLKVSRGEFLSIMGPSGSGKSTLLNIIGCLDRPCSGAYLLDGVDVLTSSDDRRSRLRSRYIGFIFQTFNLIDNLTVAENVALPFLYQTMAPKEAQNRVNKAIAHVGLSARSDHRPGELSGGEMQRAAIARALAVNPKLIVADEPTGNLDSKNSRDIMGLISRLHKQGSTIILVTHDPEVAAYAGACIKIDDGRIVHEST